MIVAITTIGRGLRSKRTAKRYRFRGAPLDDARTPADVLAVLRTAEPTYADRGALETYGEAIKRIVTAEHRPGNGGTR